MSVDLRATVNNPFSGVSCRATICKPPPRILRVQKLGGGGGAGGGSDGGKGGGGAGDGMRGEPGGIAGGEGGGYKSKHVRKGRLSRGAPESLRMMSEAVMAASAAAASSALE